MSEKNYQQFREFIQSNPKLLGSGGVFGGVGQNHATFQYFADFVGREVDSRRNEIVPVNINVGNFLDYLKNDAKLPEEEYAEIAKKLEQLKSTGQISDDSSDPKNHSFSNLARILNDLGVLDARKNPLVEIDKAMQLALGVAPGTGGGAGRAGARVGVASSNGAGKNVVNVAGGGGSDTGIKVEAGGEAKGVDAAKVVVSKVDGDAKKKEILEKDKTELEIEENQEMEFDAHKDEAADKRLRDSSVTAEAALGSAGDASAKKDAKDEAGHSARDAADAAPKKASDGMVDDLGAGAGDLGAEGAQARSAGGPTNDPTSDQIPHTAKAPTAGESDIDGTVKGTRPSANPDLTGGTLAIPASAKNGAQLTPAQQEAARISGRKIRFNPGLIPTRSKKRINRTSDLNADPTEDSNAELAPQSLARRPQEQTYRVRQRGKADPTKNMRRAVIGGSLASGSGIFAMIFGSATSAEAAVLHGHSTAILSSAPELANNLIALIQTLLT